MIVWQSRQSSHHGGNRQGGRCAAGRESAQHGIQDSVESVVLKRCACGAGKKGGRCVSAWERNSARNVDRHVGQRQFGEVAEVHWNMGGAGTRGESVVGVLTWLGGSVRERKVGYCQEQICTSVRSTEFGE